MNQNSHFITVILPCYNEEGILASTLNTIIEYLKTKSDKYSWEILIINDGSKDNTAKIADDFGNRIPEIRVIHHPVNLNLGHALQTGFVNAKGEAMVVLDVDLSYSVDMIEKLLDKLFSCYADIVIASPYMPGGKTTAIPFGRRMMSLWVNKFMRVASQDKYYTYTGMVRAYRSSYIKHLNLKTKDYEINPEIMYKSMILRATMIEIPAHLDWSEQNKYKDTRTSSMRVLKGLFSGVMSAFIFRPYIFFIAIGTFLLALSMFELIWLLYDTLHHLGSQPHHIEKSFSLSLSFQFSKNPQTFIVGGITFIAAIQFLSLGFLSLQSKRYFEELFHINSAIKREIL